MSKQSFPTQIPLELGHEAGFSRDDLIVTPANLQAAEIVSQWPDWPSPVVILAGPRGSGKTHLAEVWCAEAGATRADVSGIDAAIMDAASRGPVMIDDADAGTIDETGLFHLINAVKSADTHLLMTASRFPSGWGVMLPDLLSRLKAATLVEIHEPDDMLLSAVIVKLFADRQVVIEPHVVQFLVRRIERSLDTARRVVDAIDRMALEKKSRITRALAVEAVPELAASHEVEGDNPGDDI